MNNYKKAAIFRWRTRKSHSSQAGAYLLYVTVCESGSAEVIRYLARLLANDSQRKNEIQPPIRLALDDSRSSGSGEVESHERLVDCMHTIDDVFWIEAYREIFAFESDCDFFVDFAVYPVAIETAARKFDTA